MKTIVTSILRLLVTGAVVALALVIGWQLWVYYMEEPWTRDGRVRADVVQIAPDVSGLVTAVMVNDNQTVRMGDVLFAIDRDRYALALQQAEATVQSRQATMDQAQRDSNRYQRLNTTAVSQSSREQVESQFLVAKANYEQALADRDTAALNLDRTSVTAPVNGVVTNFGMRPGNYVTAGSGVFALVDSDSFYVSGYFEETKLPRISINDPVIIHLMGDNPVLRGHVESIANGIVDRERTDSSNLLANVNPTFSWVRLAQRIPVRIHIDSVPEGLKLIAGRTATVTVEPNGPRPTLSQAGR